MSLTKIVSKFLVIFCVVTAFVSYSSAFAAGKNSKSAKASYSPLQSSIVVDGNTGKVLHASNAKRQIHPASLTKVATLYLIFEALESGKLKMNQRLPVSKHASDVIPLRLGLKPGESITVRDIILGIIVRSANDASRVAAEYLGGSEENFAKMMTRKAKSLGMNDTNFTNASGLHNPNQKSTAVDLAKLTMAIKRDFPQYYGLFSRTSFDYRGQQIKSHNRVTANYPGAEGLKTGFTNASGCNLITTATRDNKSLIGVVTGRRTAIERDKKMMSLLDQHFDCKSVSHAAKQDSSQSSILASDLSNNSGSSKNNNQVVSNVQKLIPKKVSQAPKIIKTKITPVAKEGGKTKIDSPKVSKASIAKKKNIRTLTKTKSKNSHRKSKINTTKSVTNTNKAIGKTRALKAFN